MINVRHLLMGKITPDMDILRLKTALRLFDETYLHHRLSKIEKWLRGERISYINLDVSGSCNLNCTMCSLKDWYPKAVNKTMPWEILKKLSGVFAQLRTVNLQCNCEPFLNRELPHIVKHIKSINPGIYVSITTNGTLITSTHISQLIENRLDNIRISLDGASSGTFEKIRIGAKFDTVISNIKDLVRQRKTLFSQLPEIEIVSISSKDNLNELVEIFHLARSLGVDSFNILGLEPYTVNMSNRILYGEKIRPEYRNVFSALKKLARKHRIKSRLPSLRLKPHKTCDLRGCIIDSNGDIYPCATLSYERPFYYLDEKFIHPRIRFGNIFEKDFFEIWNSTEYKGFRRNLLDGKLPGFCQKCLMKHRVICPI